MNITKVIFFIDALFNQRDYERYGIEILKKNGFDVEVWDFTPFLQPQVYREVTVPDPIVYTGHQQFFNLKKALAAISKLDNNSFIVCLLSYRNQTFLIYRMLSYKKLDYSLFAANVHPLIDINSNLILFLNKIKKKLTFKKIFNALFTRIPFNCLAIRPASVILAGGERYVASGYPVNEKTRVLWAHTLDYDIYLKERENACFIEKGLGVFLDEYLPFHPDYYYYGVSPFTTPEKYYTLLCNFFESIEAKYGVRIVIAAHPRSQYENHPSYYKGRPVIRGKTFELVKKSQFVITHSSTAINFAVLFKKPLTFLTTNELCESLQGPWIDFVASLFGKKANNLDESLTINWQNELLLDERAYAQYKNKYIKKDGTEEKFFWQIFADYLRGRNG